MYKFIENVRKIDIGSEIVESGKWTPEGDDTNFCLNEEYQAQCLGWRRKNCEIEGHIFIIPMRQSVFVHIQPLYLHSAFWNKR